MEPDESWPKWHDYKPEGWYSEKNKYTYTPGYLRLLTERIYVQIRDEHPEVSIWQVKDCVETGKLSAKTVLETLKQQQKETPQQQQK